MMKRFILIVCGSFVGAFLAFLIFLFVGMIMSFAIMGSMGSGNSKKAVAVSKHSILKLDLGANISERGGNDPIDMMSLMRGDGLPSSLGLNTILSAIENAADDDKVDGIYIECNGLSASPATMKTIRLLTSMLGHPNSSLKNFNTSSKSFSSKVELTHTSNLNIILLDLSAFVLSTNLTPLIYSL